MYAALLWSDRWHLWAYTRGAAKGWLTSKVYRFFYMMAPDVRDELGVVVAEGEHPGNTYTPELRKSVYEANATAEALGLLFCFR